MSGDAHADAAWLRRALDLARRGWGRVQPNPLVGAVVVKDGALIAEGWHAEYGGPHGEAVALERAGERARGATLYVTLEPCAHHGQTPPCTDVILRSGITRVVAAAEDPNPRARGGADALRRAGLQVDVGVERDAARRLNAAFFHWHEHATPYVALKLALSLDGRISATRGARTALTGAAANAEVHRLRAGCDAILVGSGTVLADDPLLTARGDIAPRVPPSRIVFDSALRTPPDARLLRTIAEAPVIFVAAAGADEQRERALVARGAQVVHAARSSQGVEPADAMKGLAELGIRSVLCEGGGVLGASLLQAGLVRRLYLFYAPVLLGGEGAPAFPRGLAPRLAPVAVETHGNDVLLVLEPA